MRDYHIFTREWLNRASDPNRKLDKGDRFICLWIAFNGWMKSKYGDIKPDQYLIDKVKNNANLKRTFNELKDDTLSKSLNGLRKFKVIDMRYVNDDSKSNRYDGSFESLIVVLYQIRCNLFHGRKNILENNIDEELVHLAFDILLPLFDEYLRKNDYNYL